MDSTTEKPNIVTVTSQKKKKLNKIKKKKFWGTFKESLNLKWQNHKITFLHKHFVNGGNKQFKCFEGMYSSELCILALGIINCFIGVFCIL